MSLKTFWRAVMTDLFGPPPAAPTATPKPISTPAPQEKTMSFEDDAKAMLGRAEKLGQTMEAAITSAVAKARTEAETLAGEAMAAAEHDWAAAKTVYEGMIATLEAKVAAFTAPAPAAPPAPPSPPTLVVGPGG